MGLNMPARTVLFAELSKFDGKEFRYLSSGEYIQMSGRAGRRGLDSRGLVVQMVDDRTDTSKLREMLTGEADTLSSRFHLGYNMRKHGARATTNPRAPSHTARKVARKVAVPLFPRPNRPPLTWNGSTALTGESPTHTFLIQVADVLYIC